MSLVRHSTGELVRVKARQWDCPSCGLDKRRKIADMCLIAAPSWLVTLTIAPLRAFDADGQAVRPDRHAECDRASHLYEFTDRRGVKTWRWRVMAECAHCSAWLSGRLAVWRKRMRRAFPAFQYLWTREDHKSGVVHVHLGVIGLPKILGRAQRAMIKHAWSSLGTGFVDLSKRSAEAGDRLGWYLGKYIAKRHDQKMAKGYRRWSRTRSFAPDVLMNDWARQQQDQAAPEQEEDRPRLLGWVNPWTGQLSQARIWPSIE